MAKNLVQYDGYDMSVVCSDPTTPASGDPVRFGGLTGVAQTAESASATDMTGNPSGYTSVDFGQRVWSLSVKGADGAGNSAVAVGDTIYYVDADTPKLSKKATGYPFGIALGTVTSGSTTTINVLHIPQVAGALLGLGAAGVAAGYKVARGVASVTGTGTVVTGLATVVSVVATPQDDPDGVALAMVSATIGDQAGTPAAGSVILKAWKVTATGNATLIAATAAKNINWVAVGT